MTPAARCEVASTSGRRPMEATSGGRISKWETKEISKGTLNNVPWFQSELP